MQRLRDSERSSGLVTLRRTREFQPCPFCFGIFRSLPAFIGHNLDKIGNGTVLQRGHLFQFVPLLITHRQIELRFVVVLFGPDHLIFMEHLYMPFELVLARHRLSLRRFLRT